MILKETKTKHGIIRIEVDEKDLKELGLTTEQKLKDAGYKDEHIQKIKKHFKIIK